MLIFSVVDTFYWIQSEFPQGIAFMVLFLAFFDKLNIHNPIFKEVAISLGMLTTTVFFHPSLIFPFSFFILYKLLTLEKKEHKKWFYAAYAYAIILAIKVLFFRTIYDRWALGGLKNIYYKFPNYINIQSNKDFFRIFG